MPCASAEKVVGDLVAAVNKEQGFLPPAPQFSNTSKGYVQTEQRDASVQHILKVAVHFGFEPETFCLAVKYIDVFLSRVKVQSKYLEVISLASLVLAAKLSEEDEFIPEIQDFVIVSRSTCTPADVIRMERVMLDKLGWDMLIPTPVTFLEKYCNILEAFGYFTAKQKRSVLQHSVPTILQILTDSTFIQHRGSTIALTVLSYELSFFNESMTTCITELANYAQIHDSELMHGHSLLQDFLEMQLLMACKEKRRKKKRTHSTSSTSARTMPTIWEAGDEVAENASRASEESSATKIPVDQVDIVDVVSPSDSPSESTGNIEFPNIWETGAKCRKTDADSAAGLLNSFFSGKPLYSTVVKRSCASVAYTDGQYLVPPTRSVVQARAF